MKFNKFNLITLVVIFFLAVFYSLPNLFNNFKFNSISSILPGKTVNLGLDLKGGSYLLLKAELESVFNEKLDNTSAQIRKSLRKNKIKYKNLRTVDDRISFNIRNSNDKKKVLSLIKEYSKDFLINDQKNYFYLNLSESGINSITKSTMQQAIEIVRRRIDESGTKEPLIQQQGKDRILVQLPGIDDPDRIKRLLGKTAKLTFRFTHPEMTTETLSLSSLTPPGYILLNEQKDKNKFYMIQKKVMVSGEELTDAKAAFDQDGNPAVMFTLTTSGGKKFGRITGKNIGRPFAIILDNRVISAPIIQGQIFSNGQITWNFSVQEANDLALVLRAGALPVPLNILEERTVGPGLGNDSIIIAIIAVIIFMIISYGFYGIFANLALVTNMIFIIALLSVLQATLTLPGIAGIVLTIGMAVDANVLIFERIKEEFRVRKELLSSVENGFQKAVSTIIDANLTTFFAAFALFIFGSGPIKGFSVTLMIGLITSMYTAIVLTKFLTTAYVKRKVEKLNVQI